MYHRLANPAVCTADADVLVAAAKAALDVALEMGQRQHRVIIHQVVADTHKVEPLAAVHRQIEGPFVVYNVHRAEGPAVDFQCLQMALGGEPVAIVISVGLNYGGFGKSLLIKVFDPGAGDDIGAVLLSRVELDTDFAFEAGADAVVSLYQAGGAQVAGEIDDGLVSGTFCVGNVNISVDSGYNILFHSRIINLSLYKYTFF